MKKLKQEIIFLCTGLLCEVKTGASQNGSEQMLDHIFSEIRQESFAAELYRELLCNDDVKVRFEAARRSLMLNENVREAKKELMLLSRFSPNPILRYNAQAALNELE